MWPERWLQKTSVWSGEQIKKLSIAKSHFENLAVSRIWCGQKRCRRWSRWYWQKRKFSSVYASKEDFILHDMEFPKIAKKMRWAKKVKNSLLECFLLFLWLRKYLVKIETRKLIKIILRKFLHWIWPVSWKSNVYFLEKAQK